MTTLDRSGDARTAVGWRNYFAAICVALVTMHFAAPMATAADNPLRRLPEADAFHGVAYSVPRLAQAERVDREDDAGSDLLSKDEADQRFDALESRVDTLADENATLRKSLKAYTRPGHSGATMKVVGRIHADVWTFPDSSPGINGFESGNADVSPQDRIGFRRIRFGVVGDLPYNMLYHIEMEFAEGNDTSFRDVYLGWEELPILGTVLLGNQKRPYGLDQLNSSNDNVFIERPFVIEGFNQDARRFGLQSLNFSEDLAWNWQYGVFNQELIQDTGNYISDNWQCQIAGRLANTIWWDETSDGRGYAHWAISGTWADTDPNGTDDIPGTTGEQPFTNSGVNQARFRTRPEARSINRWLDTGVIDGGDDYALLGLESVVNVGPLQIVGEYQNVWQNRIGSEDLHFYGGYVYVSYFLTGEHMPWDRRVGRLDRVVPFEKFFLVDRCRGGAGYGLGAWQLALRWSYADFADDDIRGGIGESVTAGLNWYWTPYARLQLNYLYGEISDNEQNQAPGAPAFGHYQIIGARWMVDF